MAEAPSRQRERGTRREWIGRGALVLFGILSSFALLEATIRSGLDFYECDDHLGWRFEPGKTGFRLSRRGEFAHVVHINDAGFHDVERSVEPKDAWRSVVLGDSFVAAMQVRQEETFTSVLEDRLEKDAERSLEVINLGVDGYGTGQQLVLYREYAERLRPDLVLLAVYLYNDVRDNSEEIGDDLHSLAYRCGRPYFRPSVRGVEFARGPIPGSRAHGALSRWLRTSHLYTTLFPVPMDGNAERAYFKHDVYSRIYSQPVEEAFELTKRLLLELRNEVRDHGGRLAILIVPDRFQVAPWITEQVQKETEQSLDVDRPSRLLREFLDEEELPYLDLAPPLAGRILAGGQPYYWRDGHWNPEGHGLVAAVIHDWLHRNCASVGAPIGACADASGVPEDE